MFQHSVMHGLDDERVPCRRSCHCCRSMRRQNQWLLKILTSVGSPGSITPPDPPYPRHLPPVSQMPAQAAAHRRYQPVVCKDSLIHIGHHLDVQQSVDSKRRADQAQKQTHNPSTVCTSGRSAAVVAALYQTHSLL
jgi:hypothetical protein